LQRRQCASLAWKALPDRWRNGQQCSPRINAACSRCADQSRQGFRPPRRPRRRPRHGRRLRPASHAGLLRPPPPRHRTARSQRRKTHVLPVKRLLLHFACLALAFSSVASESVPAVTPPPESFFQIVAERDRDAARAFYKKYIDVKGMPVVAASEIADQALQRTYWIVTHLLA